MSWLRSDRGSVAAEFAVALPAVLLVLATALGGVQLAGQQLRVQDAAADVARAVARGESGATVSGRLALQVRGARWSRSMSGDLVCVRVTAAPTGPIARLGVEVSARSCALSGGR